MMKMITVDDTNDKDIDAGGEDGAQKVVMRAKQQNVRVKAQIRLCYLQHWERVG